MKYSEIMKNTQDFTKKCAAERDYKKYLKAVETERNLSTLVCPTCLGSGDSTEFEPEEKNHEVEFDHLSNQYRVGNQFFDADMVRDMLKYPTANRVKAHQELTEKMALHKNIVDRANLIASTHPIGSPGKPDVMLALGGLFGDKKTVITSSNNTAGSPLPPSGGSIGGIAAQPNNIVPAIWSSEIINSMAKQMGAQMNMPFSKPKLKPCPDCCGSGWGTTPDQPTEQGE